MLQWSLNKDKTIPVSRMDLQLNCESYILYTYTKQNKKDKQENKTKTNKKNKTNKHVNSLNKPYERTVSSLSISRLMPD